MTCADGSVAPPERLGQFDRRGRGPPEDDLASRSRRCVSLPYDAPCPARNKPGGFSWRRCIPHFRLQLSVACVRCFRTRFQAPCRWLSPNCSPNLDGTEVMHDDHFRGLGWSVPHSSGDPFVRDAGSPGLSTDGSHPSSSTDGACFVRYQQCCLCCSACVPEGLESVRASRPRTDNHALLPLHGNAQSVKKVRCDTSSARQLHHYNRDACEIYQKGLTGLTWIFWGCCRLMVYRYLYQEGFLDP